MLRVDNEVVLLVPIETLLAYISKDGKNRK